MKMKQKSRLIFFRDQCCYPDRFVVLLCLMPIINVLAISFF